MREAKKASVVPAPSRALLLSDFLDEFTASERFVSPLGWRERMQLAMARYVSRWPVVSGLHVLSPYTVSAHWQVLLNYLYREGLIAHPEFGYLPRRNDLPKSYSVVLVPNLNSAMSSGRDIGDGAQGYGNGRTVDEAYGKAIGEALERSLLSIYSDATLIRGSYRDMKARGRNPIDIFALNTFTDTQKARFPRYVLRDTSTIAWVAGTELLSGERALMPAQHVYWSYQCAPSEPLLVDPTTNAQAGHFTHQEAVAAALCEAIERDAFLMYWLNTASPPILDLSTFPRESAVHQIQRECARYGLTLYVLDITSDIAVPTCVVVIIDERSGEPTISIGACSSFDIESAIASSHLEALSVCNYAHDKERFVLPKDYEPFSGNPPIGKHERIHFWKGKEALEQFSFFISGARISLAESALQRAARTFVRGESAYGVLLDMFKARGRGYEIYCYTHEHVALKTIGYTLVKVVVPRLMPLHLRERAAALDSVRLREAAERFGRAGMPYNPLPHPFP